MAFPDRSSIAKWSVIDDISTGFVRPALAHVVKAFEWFIAGVAGAPEKGYPGMLVRDRTGSEEWKSGKAAFATEPDTPNRIAKGCVDFTD
jgi:hypothetical protein